jgi:glycosyltransferase involved in cell wall biosynthesis
MISLSIVVICRNEEARIAQCLRSVKAAAGEVGGAEILIVDSASDDRTAEIALSCGVPVLSLNSDLELSASAGRFVGFHKTHGGLVMFVDGDTVIDREWFRAAIPYFDQADVAGLMGHLDDYDAQGHELPYLGRRTTQVISSPWLRGIGMYRRTAMDEVGTFNPYLKEEEEAELAFRLTRKGWRLLAVPHKMGSHLRGATPFDFLLRRLDHRRFLLIGHALRYAVNAGNGTQFVFKRCRRAINFAVATLGLLAGTTFALMGHHFLAEVFLAILAMALVATTIKKRTLMGPIIYVADNSLILCGLFFGFLTANVKDPRDYPLDVLEVSTIQGTDGGSVTT